MNETVATSACLHCGVALPDRSHRTGPKPKHCSRACYRASRPARIIRYCAICGRSFAVKYESRVKETCSQSCAAFLRERRHPLTDEQRAERRAQQAAKRRVCARDGCDNRVRTSLARYCSPQCHYADRRANPPRRPVLRFVCETCGKEFQRAPHRGTGRWCSPQCNPGPVRAGGPKKVTPLEISEVPVIHPRALWDEGEIYCVLCGAPAQRHHAIYARHVVEVGGEVWDVRNRVGLCLPDHVAHHSGARPLPLTLLPNAVFAFARATLGAGRAYEYLLRRYHGEDPRLDALLAEWVAGEEATRVPAAATEPMLDALLQGSAYQGAMT